MANLFFTFSESLCYVLLFSCANKNFLFWHLSNDCQIARPALVSGPPNRKKSYNKHLISLVFSVRSVKYGSSFFPSIYGPRTSRLGHKSMEKNSVRNLPYGPKTRLIRGIYHLRQESIEHCLEHCFSWPAGHLHLVDEQTFWWHLRCWPLWERTLSCLRNFWNYHIHIQTSLISDGSVSPSLDQICHILQIEEGNRNRVMLGMKAQGIVHVLSPEKK